MDHTLQKHRTTTSDLRKRKERNRRVAMGSNTATTTRIFDYHAKSQWVTGEGNSVLQVELPDFKREELKVQIDNSSNIMISADRQIDHTKSSRFRQSFRMPENSKRNEIKAKFDNGVLHVTVPFKDSPATPPKETLAAGKAPSDDEPISGPAKEVGAAESAEKQINSERLGLKTRKTRIALASVVLVLVAVVLGLYTAYRLKESVEEAMELL